MKITQCPKCKSQDIGKGQIFSLPSQHYLKCNVCGYTSPGLEDEQKANNQWKVEVDNNLPKKQEKEPK